MIEASLFIEAHDVCPKMFQMQPEDEYITKLKLFASIMCGCLCPL